MMAQLRIDFQGGRKVETFSGARVQPIGNGVQLALGVRRQIRALRQVLAQQALGILIGAALPGAVRIGKEDLDRKPLGQLLVLGHLFAPIIGQRFPQWGRHMPKRLREALVRTRGIRAVHSGQQNQARRPLHQGPDSRPIACPLDEVAFPVARHRAGGHLSGAVGNRRHVGKLAASVRPPRPRPTGLAGLPQGSQSFAPQRPPRQQVQRRVEGFGREVFPHVVRIRASEASGNLLGRAALRQLCCDVLPQPWVEEFPGASWVMRSGRRMTLRRTGPIGMASCAVPSHFAAHGTRSPSQDPRHRSERMAVGQTQTHSLTFFGTQVSV